MVRQQEFQRLFARGGDFFIVCGDLHAVSRLGGAGQGKFVLTLNGDHTKQTRPNGFESVIVTQCWNVNVVFACRGQDSLVWIGLNVIIVDADGYEFVSHDFP
ncbi:MAG: hypothetical protein ACD_62C00262G0001 [uncultured bacterium]|nr:MAG: hypothetical protein ACD_62C00262G0001 [uncultured bacterium]